LESHQDHNKELQSFHTYRTRFTELSIQDLHIFNHLRPNGGNGPHNSQINKLENGTLNPKKEIFDALHSMNQEIAKKDNKFLYIPQERIRSRLKKAPPYLNHEGKVATKKDFLLIFHGLQPVNSLYTKAEKITDELLAEFSEALASTFRWVGIQNMTNNKETWDQIKKTKPIKDLKEKELVKLLQSVLIGETTPTEEQIRYVAAKYTECPMVCAYRSLVDKPLPKKMENTYSKLFELVHH